jgi:hypothetical protein
MDRQCLHLHQYVEHDGHSSDVMFAVDLGTFAFAHVSNSLLTNIGKVAVGRFRPHFIPSCFGKYSYSEFCHDPNEWIMNYTCIGEMNPTFISKDDAFDIR